MLLHQPKPSSHVPPMITLHIYQNVFFKMYFSKFISQMYSSKCISCIMKHLGALTSAQTIVARSSDDNFAYFYPAHTFPLTDQQLKKQTNKKIFLPSTHLTLTDQQLLTLVVLLTTLSIGSSLTSSDFHCVAVSAKSVCRPRNVYFLCTCAFFNA